MNSITIFYELGPSTVHGESCLAEDLDAAVCTGMTAATGGPFEGSYYVWAARFSIPTGRNTR
jgi:hypothetical protein